MSESNLDQFLELSSVLTGFTKQTLTYAQQDADFFGTFSKVYGKEPLDSLLVTFSQIIVSKNMDEKEAVEQILFPNAKRANLKEDDLTRETKTARALMVFWYLGQIAPNEGKEPLQIPGANFYAQGLAWRAVQAHPTGVSNLQFGYWENDPPALDKFL